MSGLTIGVDIAKRFFQVHVVDASDQVLVNKKLRRSEFLAFFEKLPPSLIGMDSSGSAHHWARELIAMDHDVKLMTPMYVKPYVKRGKNDALAATVADPVAFPSGRAFAAWLGLTTRSNSSGGKERNGRITKAGDRHLRTLLVVGATSVIRAVMSGRQTPLYGWVKRLLDTGKPPRLVTVALANKIARIVWAVMAGKAEYQPEKAALAA